MTTDAWGIDDGWEDTASRWHEAPPTTMAAIRDAMGGTGEARPVGRGVRVVRPGERAPLDPGTGLVLEDGTDIGQVDLLPADLPLGIHQLVQGDEGWSSTLIVSPGRCHLPAELQAWGVAMQVPTTRSREGWGLGDLADVATVARWLDGLGAGALALSPLHAPTPVNPIQTSPYYPSSRRWRSPLAIRVDRVPGAAESPEVAELAARARAASAGPVLDRDAVWRSQRAALELLWRSLPAPAIGGLGRWRADQGPALEGWARYCALADEHGPGWSRWPVGLRHPDGPEVEAEARRLADRVAFHAWLQSLAAAQLQAANVGQVRLIQDLAIGVDPDGADAWLLQDILALDMSVGAPPDDFAPDGQQWGLPPFIPWRLRDAGYRPFAELLRASMAPGGGLRVDHVMGLSRLFWVPADQPASEGTYVRFAGREMLEVLALESVRAQALVVGEDLGTVEDRFRDELHDTGVLSTRLVWFEDVPPERYPRQALAMVTTHDLPTIAGVWTGADRAELEALGRPADDGPDVLRDRLVSLTQVGADALVAEVVDDVHRCLGQTRSVVALATLEDLCHVTLRPNVPGTTDERPNWSMALPLSVEELTSDATVAERLRLLAPEPPD